MSSAPMGWTCANFPPFSFLCHLSLLQNYLTLLFDTSGLCENLFLHILQKFCVNNELVWDLKLRLSKDNLRQSSKNINIAFFRYSKQFYFFYSRKIYQIISLVEI